MRKGIFLNTLVKLSAICLVAVMLTCVSFVLYAPDACATLRGSAEWTFKDYKASQGDETITEASQFSQSYSLYWQKSGALAHGRAGHYNLGLGYEWTSFATEINDYDTDASTGKILYRGEIIIAPGALPFRLRAFSYDNEKTLLTTSHIAGSIIQPSFVTDIRNGQRTTTGLTLMVGIRNGSYLGRYREILSKYPRLFIDYKEDYVRDLTGRKPEHNRHRNLAFVSLNKKDNWFHYRYKEFTDYVNKDRGFEERSYVLGTIDHHLRRHWINMTNWIKLSVDGNLYEVDNSKLSGSTGHSETYLLNLFTDFRRKQFRVSNFNSFSRTVNQVETKKQYELPVYGNGWINPDISWRSTVINYAEDTQNDDRIGLSGSVFNSFNEEGTYAKGELSIGHRKKLLLKTRLEGETRQTDNTEGLATRVLLEAATNPRYRSRQSYQLGYSVMLQDGENQATINNKDASYLEQELFGSYNYTLSSRHRLTLTQKFLLGSGDSDTNVTSYINPKGGYGLLFGSQQSTLTSGEIFHSTTSLGLESTLSPRLQNSVIAYFDFIDSEDDRLWQSVLQHKLNYDKPQWRYRAANSLMFGDDISLMMYRGSQHARLAIGNVGEPDMIVEHMSTLDYLPNRNFESTASLDFAWTGAEDDNVFQIHLSQDSRYTFYNIRGYIRKIADVYQEVDYEHFTSDVNDGSYLALTLGGNYYPYRIFEFGGEVIYEMFDPADVQILKFRARAAVNFTKLQCEAIYSYGLGTSDASNVGDRKEHLIEANVRKQF